MTAVSELFPAGGGNNTIEMVASGALSNGDKVVLQSDGTVKVITQILSPPVQFSTNFGQPCMTFDSVSNKVLIFYTEGTSSNYGAVIVGTVSGSSISFGTPYIWASWETVTNTATFDSNSNKVVLAYKRYASGVGYYGELVVGSVSGDTVNFGSPQTYHSTNPGLWPESLLFNPNNNRIYLFYCMVPGPYTGKVYIGSVSGNTVNFDMDRTFSGTSQNDSVSLVSPVLDITNNRIIVSFQQSANYALRAIVGVVSGNDISFGSAYYIPNATNVNRVSSTYDSNSNRVITSYADTNNSHYGTTVVGTVSGSSITFGTQVIFSSGDVQGKISSTFDSINNEVVILYREGGAPTNGSGASIIGTVSGTSIIFDPMVIYESTSINEVYGMFIPGLDKVVVTNKAWYGKGKYTVLPTSSTNLTAGNFIGIAQAAVADTETVEVETLGGLATNLSGLTIGSKYYVQDDGTTTTDSAGQFLGRAVTATTINMKDFA